QFALARQRDVGGLQLGPAKGDVGGDAVAGCDLLDDAAIRRDHRDAARNQRRDADIAAGFHRKRIEHLVAAEPRDRLAALAAIDDFARLDGAGFGDFIGPQPRGRRLRNVDRLLVRRQADAVGGQHAVHGFDDLLHAGFEIIERADIHLAGAALAEIGEPEAAVLVEHQVVRPPQRVLAASVDYGLDLAAMHVDALDRAALIVVGLRPRHDHLAGGNPAEAAIVADVHLAVGPQRRAIGA